MTPEHCSEQRKIRNNKRERDKIHKTEEKKNKTQTFRIVQTSH
jgi:hypothetical protein